MQEYAGQAGAAADDSDGDTGYEPERDGFDMAWARSAEAHELSAHGRSVQRRLETPVGRRKRPSLVKRLRFALYRLLHGR